MFKKITLSLALCAALFARENVKTLEDMTVTSDKRETKLFEADSSINVITETDIKDFGIDNTFDIENYISNMFLQTTARYSPNIFGSIRGITSTEGYNPAFSIYVNDVYQHQTNFGLIDVERIEVLKGPQGTLYGKNAEAGVVNIITKKPNPKKLEGKIKLEVGQENTKGIIGDINVPLSDNSAVKVTLGRHEDDGYFKNEFDGDDTQKQKNTDARVEFYIKPTDKLEAYLTYAYQDYKNDDLANLTPFSDDMTKVNVNYMGYSNYETHQASLNLTYDLDFAKLQSITSLSYYKGDLSNDLDTSPIDMMRMLQNRKKNFVSEELRLVSQKNEDFDYLVGMFAFTEKSDFDVDITMNMPTGTMNILHDTTTETDGIAFFGEGSYYFGDFKATLGMRYDREKLDHSHDLTIMGNSSHVDADETFDAFLPKLALAYYVNDNVKPYFSVARGYRSGGFNISSNPGKSYDPEYTWNYELGVKTQFSNFMFNAALFYIDWKDLQVDITLDNGANFYMENAAKAESKGIELEALWQATQNLLISANFGYTNAKYTDYSNGAGIYDNNYVKDVPKYTYNLSGRYRFNNGIYVGANMASFHDIYFDNENTKKQSYTIVNAKIGYEYDNFDIYIYGKNLFDEDYVTRAFLYTFGGNNQWIGRAGQPQKFGLEFTYKF